MEVEMEVEMEVKMEVETGVEIIQLITPPINRALVKSCQEKRYSTEYPRAAVFQGELNLTFYASVRSSPASLIKRPLLYIGYLNNEKPSEVVAASKMFILYNLLLNQIRDS